MPKKAQFGVAVRSGLLYGSLFAATTWFALVVLVRGKRWTLAERLAWQRRWASCNRHLFGRISGLRDRVIGLENLPAPPYVVLAKHQSAWETLVLPSIFPPGVWVLKRSLLEMPFFGRALRLVGAIGIDRSRGSGALRTMLRDGRAHLDDGRCVLIFPEGTRFEPGTAGNYRIGGAALGAAANVPIVPVAHNAGEFWGAYRFLVCPGTIEVRIGQPIDPAQQDSRSVLAAVQRAIETMMAEITNPVYAASKGGESVPVHSLERGRPADSVTQGQVVE